MGKSFQIKGELAFILNLFLQPILEQTDELSFRLQDLIKKLNLPAAQWHDNSLQRKQRFEKAIKEVEANSNFIFLMKEDKSNSDNILIVSKKKLN